MNASAAGYTYYTQEGTYSVSEDGNEIVFSFPTAAGTTIGNMSSYSGTFPFSQGEDHILIGGTRYEMVSEDSNQEDASAIQQAEQEFLSGDALALPDMPYQIVYTITDEGENGGISYTQSIIKTEDVIALSFSGGAEQYVFERLASGKYAMYVYDNIKGSFVSSASSPVVQALIDQGVMSADTLAVDQTVVDGYCARIDQCMNSYATFRVELSCEGIEQCGDTVCLKYTAPYQTTSGNQEISFLIDPESKICMKGEYFYTDRLGRIYRKTIAVSDFLTDNIEIPDYK